MIGIIFVKRYHYTPNCFATKRKITVITTSDNMAQQELYQSWYMYYIYTMEYYSAIK